jgi:hypothetical protein
MLTDAAAEARFQFHGFTASAGQWVATLPRVTTPITTRTCACPNCGADIRRVGHVNPSLPTERQRCAACNKNVWITPGQWATATN